MVNFEVKMILIYNSLTVLISKAGHQLHMCIAVAAVMTLPLTYNWHITPFTNWTSSSPNNYYKWINNIQQFGKIRTNIIMNNETSEYENYRKNNDFVKLQCWQ